VEQAYKGALRQAQAKLQQKPNINSKASYNNFPLKIKKATEK
jgi:hypothetical protein